MDEQNPADEILAHYRPSLRGQAERAWAQSPDRDRLELLWSERQENGERRWFQVVEPDPDDPEFVRLMLRPVDPLDQRPAHVVGRWLVKALTMPEERAQAIVEEHRND